MVQQYEMKSWKTAKGTTVIRVLSGRCNAYLILTGNDIILADTGKLSSFGRLSRSMDLLNTPIESVTILILTHTHFDHCQSAKKIKDISGCQIIVSQEASGFVHQGFTKLPRGTFLITNIISKLGNYFGKKRFGYDPFQPDLFVNGNLTIRTLNGRIKLIETKGHSDDSISIIIDDEIAVVGDVLFGVFKNSIFPPFADNTAKLAESWRLLFETDCELFLPGHGRETNRDRLEMELKKMEL